MKVILKLWSAALTVLWISTVEAVGSLHRMNVKRDLVTLSGSSSGGTMAQQMFVSHSSKFQGVASISHAYYRCGSGILPNQTVSNDFLYDVVCTKIFDPLVSQLYDPANAVADILDYFALGLIDDPKYMANKPLYVFAGSSSYLFPLDLGLGTVQVFQPFISNRDKIKVVVQPANATLPSDRPGLPDCSAPLNSIWVSNCGFSAAFEALQWILGKKYVRAPSKAIKLQPLLEFDQTEFFYGFGDEVISEDPFMDAVGYYYIPKVCRRYGHKCLLHFYFHGCMTSRNVVGPNHILNSGYLEVAETNGIIMVFPQTMRSPLGSARGCWDTYAFTGEFYATQLGGQVVVVKNMFDRIVGPDDKLSTPYVEAEPVTPTKYPKMLVVSPELLRSYGDDTEDGTPTDQESDLKNRHCTTTRVSPDTVVKRCRPIE